VREGRGIVKLTLGCRYDDIKIACIPHLVSALRNDTAEKTTWTKLCEIIESYFKGDLQHATDTLSLLWKAASQDGHPMRTMESSCTHPVSLFPVRLSVEVKSEILDRPPLHT
jgi:hypothetical protein